MKPFWKKINDAAIKVLGPGPLTIVVDRASCHVSKFSRAETEKHFELVVQPPASPDFNLLGACVFPSLEKKFNASGADSHAQIKKAAREIWKKATPDDMERAVAKAKRNMAKSAAIGNAPGGKFL